MVRKSQIPNCEKSQLWRFVTFVTSGPYLCLTKIRKFCSPLKTVPIISGNFVMKSRFACAESFSVRKHTNTFFPDRPFCLCNGFSGQNLENSTNTVLKNRDRVLSNGPTTSSVRYHHQRRRSLLVDQSI